MSNVYSFLPKLTVNRQFIGDFLAAQSPCFALGLVEERKQQRGFLALRPGETIPSAASDAGFNFGHSLRGKANAPLIHFAFEFYGFGTYNALVNPNNPLVQTVLRTMVESGDYFFFAIGPDQYVTAFRSEIGEQDLAGLKTNLKRTLGASTTDAQYRQAVAQFQRNPDPPGRLLTWVCADNAAYLDLSQDRLEMCPSASDPVKVATQRKRAPEKSSPELNWHPLSMLHTIAMLIDEELDGAEEQQATLLKAREWPHVLDDEIVHRLLTLFTDELEFIPIHREQLMRWRAASPPPAQRDEIERLTKQLDRLEVVLKEVLTLAKELEPGTIDAILRMEDGELGLALFEGRMAPPDGEPLSEDLRVREAWAIAELLDARVEELEEEGIHHLELLAEMAPQLPLFKRLMEIAGEDDFEELYEEFPGLYHLAELLERVAAGIQSGDIKVPS